MVIADFLPLCRGGDTGRRNTRLKLHDIGTLSRQWAGAPRIASIACGQYLGFLHIQRYERASWVDGRMRSEKH